MARISVAVDIEKRSTYDHGLEGHRGIPPTYSLAICSNHKLAKAKAKANYDQWPLAGYPARKAGESVMIPGGIMVS